MKNLMVILAMVFAVGCGSDETALTTAGLSILSNKVISSSATDLCTGVTGEGCFFDGGQIVTYSDGSTLLLGAFSFVYSNAGDTDTDHNTVSAFFPATTSTSTYVVLSTFVNRGSGYRSLFLVHYVIGGTELVQLKSDTNNNKALDDSDLAVTSLTLSDWP